MAIASHECKPGCYHGTEEISLGISAYPEEIRGRNDDCIDHELRREYREDAEEMTTPILLLSDLTMTAIQAEAMRAHARHGINSMLYGDDDKSLRILMEEVGEVAREMNELALGNIDVDTYNQRLVKELIQVAAMAGTWVEKIEGVG